jgi:hypothetical protein
MDKAPFLCRGTDGFVPSAATSGPTSSEQEYATAIAALAQSVLHLLVPESPAKDRKEGVDGQSPTDSRTHAGSLLEQ